VSEKHSTLLGLLISSVSGPQIFLISSSLPLRVLHLAFGLQHFFPSAAAVHSIPLHLIAFGLSLNPFPPSFLHKAMSAEPVTEEHGFGPQQ
jgi:hypothetical protein